jgi:hypothetical protein
MARVLLVVWSVALALAVSELPRSEPRLETGDLVFQSSRSAAARAIEQGTDSPFSHVGIVEVSAEGPFVVEAVQPVSRTPWKIWRARGRGGRVVVKRPVGLAPADRARAVAWARQQQGKPYDTRFGWGDDAFYCSELVRKAFERGAGVELGAMQRLGALRLKGLGPALSQRFRGQTPLDLELVTPARLAADPKLRTVFSSYPAAAGAR